MAALSAAASVVASQQQYAKTHDIGSLFEALTVSVLTKKPANTVAFLAEEAAKLSSVTGPIQTPAAGRGIDTEEGAAKYLEQNGVQSLLEELLTAVLVTKPAKPIQFLAELCARRAAGEASPFFNDDDLKGVHSLFDATHNNSITAEQARTALKALGVSDVSSVPASGNLDQATWVQLARVALAKKK